jgi:hypothetical protein
MTSGREPSTHPPELRETRAEHFVITRFSVKFFADSPPFPRRWLEDRLRLFEAYCLPSVASQTCRDFTWLLLCDESTDGECVDELSDLASAVADGTVVMTSPHRSVLAEITQRVRPDADVLITSRLDSDDAVAVDFVGRIQGYLEAYRGSPRETMLLSFSQGRSIETRSGALYDSFQPHGPFMSLFEDLSADAEPLTVYSGNHAQLHLDHPLHVDASRAAWLQVLHGQNVNNHVRAIDLRIPSGGLGEQFSIRPEVASGRSGLPAPDADRIRATGERGIEGIREIQRRAEPSGITG